MEGSGGFAPWVGKKGPFDRRGQHDPKLETSAYDPDGQWRPADPTPWPFALSTTGRDTHISCGWWG
jgi:hypothetical protein